eukprot:TRINITY_DN9193_c0_g1_i1.p1 TRINITY_DN9193_c0_g1~~TRINITY_DN9193_c0_g1_i1.p1  ORF type:complete len:313 (+),score=71.12 TRINITY_DN9193_c0_g1_i1:44-940(+)
MYVPKQHVLRLADPPCVPLSKDLTRIAYYNCDPVLCKELAAIVREVFELDKDYDLSKLHETDLGKKEVARRGRPERTGRLTRFNKEWYNVMKPGVGKMDKSNELRKRFQTAYQQLIRELVADAIGEDDEVIFQMWPTFRVHLPGTDKGVGRRHRDYDYLHPPTELNFWLPIGCQVYDTNSLYAESEPCKGDYTPFTTEPNQMVRFYGSLCDHFTLPNTTPHTRVSIDFRVIRKQDYTPEAAGPQSQFIIGRHYSSLKLSDPLETGVSLVAKTKGEPAEIDAQSSDDDDSTVGVEVTWD